MDYSSEIVSPFEVGTETCDHVEEVGTDELCRICATANEYLIKIFEGEGLENGLCDKINSLLPIKVSSEDKLTHLICYQCASHLLAWDDLRECSLRADKHLRNIQILGSQIKDQTVRTSKQKSLYNGQVQEDPMNTECSNEQADIGERFLGTTTEQNDNIKEYCIYPEMFLIQSEEQNEDLKRTKDTSVEAFLTNEHKFPKIIVEEPVYETSHSDLTESIMNSTLEETPRVDIGYYILDEQDKLYGDAIKRDYDVYDFTGENENLDNNALDIVLDTEQYADEDPGGFTYIENVQQQGNTTKQYICDNKRTLDSVNKFKHYLDSFVNAENESTVEDSKGMLKVENVDKKKISLRTCSKCNKVFRSRSKMLKHHQFCENILPTAENNLLLHVCWICNSCFSSKEELAVHKKLHILDNDRLKCPYCETTCLNNKYLKIHLELHSSRKIYDCEICHKVFKRKSNLENHLSNHVNDFPCSVCCNSYNTEFCLSRHLASHSEYEINSSRTSPSYLMCTFVEGCQEKFDSKLKYFTHKKIHMNVIEYKCDICSKSYKSVSILANHKKVHESTCKCTTCGKQFSNHKTLKEHIRLHTGELPFECKYCQQKFRCQSFLAVHVLAHTGVRNYACRFCQQTFTRSTYLKEHLRTHTNDKPFICKYCNQGYTQSGVLNKHVATMHRKCDICDEIVGDKTKLQVHKWKLHSNKELNDAHNTDMFILNDSENILIGEETVVEV